LLSHQLIVVFGWCNRVGECWFVSKCDIKREHECLQYNFWHKDTQMNKELLSSGRVLGVDEPLTMGFGDGSERRSSTSADDGSHGRWKWKCEVALMQFLMILVPNWRTNHSQMQQNIVESLMTMHLGSWMETFYAVWVSVWLNWSMKLVPCNSALVCALWHKRWPNNWSITHKNSTTHS
jgi:hypothetical protein